MIDGWVGVSRAKCRETRKTRKKRVGKRKGRGKTKGKRKMRIKTQPTLKPDRWVSQNRLTLKLAHAGKQGKKAERGKKQYQMDK